MKSKQIPLYLEKSREPIYGNFGYRLAALLLDFVILLPVSGVIVYFDAQALYNFYYTSIINLVVVVLYNVLIPLQFGATPGKLIVGLKFLKINGEAIRFKDAFIRYSPYFISTIISIICMGIAVSKADPEEFADLPWIEQSDYLNSFARIPMLLNGLLVFCLVLTDLIIYLASNRYQSLKDTLAGTVVIFKHMETAILEEVNRPEPVTESIPEVTAESNPDIETKDAIKAEIKSDVETNPEILNETPTTETPEMNEDSSQPDVDIIEEGKNEAKPDSDISNDTEIKS